MPRSVTLTRIGDISLSLTLLIRMNTTNTTAHPVEKVGATGATFVDQRLGSNKFLSRNLSKVFPEHWSFMLGEIALSAGGGVLA